MPKYDYICPTCNKVFEYAVAYEDRDCVLCLTCGELSRRVWITAPGIAFKGTGWTKNESGWKSMLKEKAQSDRELAGFNKETHDKNFEKALNEARDWNDQDHADYESYERTKRLENPDGNSRVLVV